MSKEVAKKQSKESEYIFWFRTPQTGIIKSLFESVKDVLPDGELIVTKKGIYLEGSNSQESIIVNLFLDAKKIQESGEFKCFEDARIGIDMRNLNVFLKNAEPRHIITLCMERNTPTNQRKEDFLCIRFEDQASKSIESHLLSTMEPSRQRIQIPHHEYSCARAIASGSLQRYIKTMKNIGSVCKITNVNDNEFRLSTKGLIGEWNVKLISDTEDDDTEDDEDDEEEEKPQKGKQKIDEQDKNKLITGEFKIKYLEYLVRPSNLCSKVYIGIDDQVPLIAKFSISSLGFLQYIIAQHIETDD